MEGDAVLGITRADAQLAAAGDRAAFARLVATHNRSMERVAFVITGDSHMTEDAVQSAWLIAWQRIPRLREPARVGVWLVAIAANEARQLARKRRRSSVRELALDTTNADPPTTPPPDDAIDRADLARLLEQLSPDDRELLALRYVAGLSADELGRITGRSSSGVRGRLSRVTSRLRRDLPND